MTIGKYYDRMDEDEAAAKQAAAAKPGCPHCGARICKSEREEHCTRCDWWVDLPDPEQELASQRLMDAARQREGFTETVRRVAGEVAAEKGVSYSDRLLIDTLTAEIVAAIEAGQ